MTHPNLVTNGASLEDCHTNFFALADLCGIKWRRYCADNLLCLDPLDDPVLSSFSKCSAADLLCVWRHVARQSPPELHQQPLYSKELWIFWYGEEPDLNGLGCSDLTGDQELGSWETGLSYECRSLLFKALHNLIERCLLSRGFSRLGRWFLQPFDASERLENKNPQLSFAFNFFVHGDSTVCASVDVRQFPVVYKLNKQHLLAAHASQPGPKVILGPHGLSGTLTGQSFKESDPATQRLLSEWRQFYPLPPRESLPRDQEDDTIPCVVEVVAGGVKMRYPSAYVLLVETDEVVRPSPANVSNGYQARNASLANSSLPSQQKSGPLVGVLTPPTSPCDPSQQGSMASSQKYGTAPSSGSQQDHHHPFSISQDSPMSPPVHTTTSFKVKSSAWQDSTIPMPRGSTLPPDLTPEEVNGHWDFLEPCTQAQCNCYRCKSKTKTASSNSTKSSSTGGASNSTTAGATSNTTNCGSSGSNSASGTGTGSSGSSSSAQRKSDRQEKDKVQPRLRGMTPFHRRSPTIDSMLDLDSLPLPQSTSAVSGANTSASGSFQYKGSSGLTPVLRAATPSTLPQLQTSLTQPASVESSHPDTPSLLVDGPSSQLSSAADPAMPTLSPHPPLPKEEEGARTESQESAAPVQSPVSTTDVPSNSSAKEKGSGDQMSPFPNAGSSLLESKPPEGSPSLGPPSGNWPSAAATPVEEPSTPVQPAPPSTPQQQQPAQEPAQPTQSSTQQQQQQPAQQPPQQQQPSAEEQKQTVPHGLKRPSLPTGTHEDEDKEDLSSGILYDYSTVCIMPWESPPVKRRRNHLRETKDSHGDCKRQLEDVQLPQESKDPYEFKDEFDEDGASADPNVKKTEVVIKEEEKQISTAPVTPDPATPNSASPSNKDETKSNFIGDLQCITSPPTPRHQGFTREADLMVTERDLENIFDTSSSDGSSDDPFQPPSTPSSTKLKEMSDESSAKIKNPTSGILGPVELTRMFPTPPSLEHNTAQSPSGPPGVSDLTLLDGVDPFTWSSRADIYSNNGSPSFETTVRDWSYVYKPPMQYKYLSSSRYAPLTSLPSTTLPPLSLPQDMNYKPTWQQHILPAPLPTGEAGATNMSSGPASGPGMMIALPHGPAERHPPAPPSHPPILAPDDQRLGPMFPPMEVSLDRGIGLSYELQSPASNASSYLNKHLNSMDSSGTTSYPEADSLRVNLVLSDSLLNIFRDHNFTSCTLCVCNMNIKGADIGVYLPNSLVPSASDEPQYKCACGFSAVVNRHHSHHAGLFYEDEVEITGLPYEATEKSRRSLLQVEGVKRSDTPSIGTTIAERKELREVDTVPHNLVDLVQSHCSGMALSPCSVFYKAVQLQSADRSFPQYNLLQVLDGCEIIFTAIDTSRQANDSNPKMDESLKSSCLHKWPYLQGKSPCSSSEVVQLLRGLQPLLQEAVQKKRNPGMWEVTYRVSGPLTWRQFHRLAGRGTEDQCEPQPIPSLLVGYDKDWLALSPFALKYWDKLLLEPYAMPRDVAYVVVAPENELILSYVKGFFRELSSVYEMSRLGRHCPITKVLRDGILRVGKSTAKKLSDEPVDEWFNLLGDGPVGSKLKLYAQACRHHLAPHLAKQPLDKSLLEGPPPPPPPAMKAPEKPAAPAASPRPPSTPENQDKEKASTPKPTSDQDNCQDNSSSANSSQSNSSSQSSGSSSASVQQDSSENEEENQPPAMVVYLVEPFTYDSSDSDLLRLSTLGLFRCYTQMLRYLPENIQNNIHVQVVTLDSIINHGKFDDKTKRQDQLKALAFSVFYQCTRILVHQPTVKSLTGFGPAAAQDMFLKSKGPNSTGPMKMWSPPFILAPQKDKQTELGEMFGDNREKSGILFCTYCLTEDQRWLLASVINDKGDLLDNCCINIEIPNRTRRRKVSARKIGLHKLLEFILGILSLGVQTWRLVVGRLGRLGHGELKEWAVLLGRKSLLRYSKRLKEMCRQCAVQSSNDTPCILSACLVSLEPDSVLQILSDQYTPDERFNSSCHSCDLSTPQDATCTHILVFPTSATTQSSQATFVNETSIIDPLSSTLGEDDEIFKTLTDDIACGNDFNDFFRCMDSPEPAGSPRRDSASPPGSPGGTAGGRQSPFQNCGAARGSSGMAGDAQDEPMQLLQNQPLALGYYVSTAKTGNLPKWFWSSCPHLENSCPVFLKSALLLHCPTVHQNHDDILHNNTHIRNYHPLDSSLTTDVLRYVLEGYNALSWLSLDPFTHDRQSCLPLHMQNLMRLYHAMEAFV